MHRQVQDVSMDAAHSQEQEDLTVTKKIFLQHLEKREKMVKYLTDSMK